MIDSSYPINPGMRQYLSEESYQLFEIALKRLIDSVNKIDQEKMTDATATNKNEK